MRGGVVWILGAIIIAGVLWSLSAREVGDSTGAADRQYEPATSTPQTEGA